MRDACLILYRTSFGLSSALRETNSGCLRNVQHWNRASWVHLQYYNRERPAYPNDRAQNKGLELVWGLNVKRFKHVEQVKEHCNKQAPPPPVHRGRWASANGLIPARWIFLLDTRATVEGTYGIVYNYSNRSCRWPPTTFFCLLPCAMFKFQFPPWWFDTIWRWRIEKVTRSQERSPYYRLVHLLKGLPSSQAPSHDMRIHS